MSEATEENQFIALLKRNNDALEKVEALLSTPAPEPTLDLSPIVTAHKQHEERSAKILSEAFNLSKEFTDEQHKQLQEHAGKFAELDTLVRTLRPSRWASRPALAAYGLFVGFVLAGVFSWWTISTNMNPYMCKFLSGDASSTPSTQEKGCFIAFKGFSEPI